jgi:hypothetical protein
VNVTSGYGNLHYLSRIYRGKFHTKMTLEDLEGIISLLALFTFHPRQKTFLVLSLLIRFINR